MKKISKEAKIGFAFLVAIFLLYFGISFLKGFNIFKSSTTVLVVFDNAEGLTQATPVTLNGFQVGVVSSMQLIDNKHIVTNINMNKGIEITKGSKMTLDVSVLGSATIALEINPYTKEHVGSEDTIIGIRKRGLLDAASSLTPQLEQLVPKIDSILFGIQALVNNPALHQSLTNVDVITQDLAQTTKQLTTMTVALNKDVPVITGNLKTMSSDLSSTTSQFKKMDFVKIYSSIDSTMVNFNKMTTKMNSTDNTMGLLLNDRQLHDSLTNVLNDASNLLKDVKESPKKYINIKVF